MAATSAARSPSRPEPTCASGCWRRRRSTRRWRSRHGRPATVAACGAASRPIASGSPAGRARTRRSARAAVRAGGLGIAALRGIPRALLPRLLRLRSAPPPWRRPADLPGAARLGHRRRALVAGGRPRRRATARSRSSSTGPRSIAPAISRSSTARRRTMLLGEMQAHVDRRVHVGESCTVIGWRIGAEGRKHRARHGDLRRGRRAVRTGARDLDRAPGRRAQRCARAAVAAPREHAVSSPRRQQRRPGSQSVPATRARRCPPSSDRGADDRLVATPRARPDFARAAPRKARLLDPDAEACLRTPSARTAAAPAAACARDSDRSGSCRRSCCGDVAAAQPVGAPFLQDRLRRLPQVELRVELAAEALDLQQRLLQQDQLRLHAHVEAARDLEQAHQHLRERDLRQRLVEDRLADRAHAPPRVRRRACPCGTQPESTCRRATRW